jgi:hypothetical protein
VTKSGCSSRQVVESFGGASRDRTDDLIVANDVVIGLACLHFQTLASPKSGNQRCFLERIWNVSGTVRKPGGSSQPTPWM